MSMRLDAQRRECEATVVFHAGRALELALHVLYARGADRILGRDYPGVPEDQVRQDRKTHSLVCLHSRIVKELDGRDMDAALEQEYQKALNKGILDIFIDGKRANGVYLPENKPFKEVRISKVMDGAEMTLDHLKDSADLIGFTEVESEFTELSEDTFVEFLKKADVAYYGKKNMRWAHYTARDHEYGRPYIIIGSEFFARLAQGIVKLSNQQWTWDKNYLRRFHERRQYNIAKIMEAHAQQNFLDPVDFPCMKSVDKMMEDHVFKPEFISSFNDHYRNKRERLEFTSK